MTDPFHKNLSKDVKSFSFLSLLDFDSSFLFLSIWKVMKFVCSLEFEYFSNKYDLYETVVDNSYEFKFQLPC